MPKAGGKVDVAKVDTYTLEVTQALTALQLLESPENEIVLLSICTLDTYVSKFGKAGLSFLQEKNLLQKLFMNLQNVQATRSMCLKILVQLIQLEGIMQDIQTNFDLIRILIVILLSTEDAVEIEYLTYLLSRICELISCAELLCDDNIINKLFTTIATQLDLDVKNNCLELILRVVNCHQKREMISTTPSFRVKILNLVIQGPFPVLRPITVEILTIISNWEFDAMQDQLFESETISYLFDILSETIWTNVQNSALTTIYNCLKYHPIQVKCIESKKFLKFVNFSRNSDPDHALACIALIGAFVTEKENRQVLRDLGVHLIISDFCKFDDDLIYIKFCKTLTEFCKNCHIIEELATPAVIKEIERLMRKTHLTWLPYRQAGLQPLYLFLMNNPRLGILFYQTSILKHILDALLHRDELETFYYKMALEMFQSMLVSRCLHRYMWTPTMYCKILSLLTDCDTELIKIAIDIIQRTFYSQEYRDWFLDFGGVEYLNNMLCRRDCDYIQQAIAFCKFVTKYDDFCTALLRKGLIPVVQAIGSTAAHQRPICDSIVADIYKCELSIKFHDTRFLNYQDVTKNGFILYVGFKPRSFPPEEVDDLQKLSFTSTMLIVNFHGKQRGQVPIALAHKEVKEAIRSEHSKESNATEVKTELNPIEGEEAKYIFKLNLPTADKNPTTDYYLKAYLRDVQHLIDKEENDTAMKKIIVLAKFVVAHLSGFDGKMPVKHQYETHILELKKKLQSNYIPLGHIRIGGMVERALLFKVLADRLGIPATFRRTSDYCAWNEVSVYDNSPNCTSSNLRFNLVQHYVVDLMGDTGALLLLGQKNTELYYKKSQKYAQSFEDESVCSISEPAFSIAGPFP